MVHDYWMYVDDPAFVKQMLPGVRAILAFYQFVSGPRAVLSAVCPGGTSSIGWARWKNGEPPAGEDGADSAALNLQLLLAYRWAGDLEASLGLPTMGAIYRDRAEHLKTTVMRQDFDSARGLFADQPSHRTYSQQREYTGGAGEATAG